MNSNKTGSARAYKPLILITRDPVLSPRHRKPVPLLPDSSHNDHPSQRTQPTLSICPEFTVPVFISPVRFCLSGMHPWNS